MSEHIMNEIPKELNAARTEEHINKYNIKNIVIWPP